MTEKEIFQEVTIQDYGAPKMDLIQAAYNQYVEYAMKAIELMPYTEPKPLTRKQKLQQKISYRKWELGKKFLKIANKLGAYNDYYD